MIVSNGDAEDWSALALGPLAVQPSYQGRGVGAALVRAGLELCEARGMVVFVLGDPQYYERFGFERAAHLGLHYLSHEHDAHFQVLEQGAAVLDERKGWVTYDPEFDEVD